ncbi:hypothetical protein HK102_005828 [Quaeritorhiza haematococci]|nr:hypothetical protein HK102_005828 [Quaeritorhiza haematococci]
MALLSVPGNVVQRLFELLPNLQKKPDDDTQPDLAAAAEQQQPPALPPRRKPGERRGKDAEEDRILEWADWASYQMNSFFSAVTTKLGYRLEFPVYKRGVVVLTGAGSGIGAHAAQSIATQGFTVIAGCRTQEEMKRLRAWSPPLRTPSKDDKGEEEDELAIPGGIVPILLDVTREEDLARVLELVETYVQGGYSDDPAKSSESTESLPLVGIVNCEATSSAGPIEMLSAQELLRSYEINAAGAVRIAQVFLPLLRKYRGRIVNVSSCAGLFAAAPANGSYAAAKVALEAISDSMRVELYRWGISVSIVEPGAMDPRIWFRRPNINQPPSAATVKSQNRQSLDETTTSDIERDNAIKEWRRRSAPPARGRRMLFPDNTDATSSLPSSMSNMSMNNRRTPSPSRSMSPATRRTSRPPSRQESAAERRRSTSRARPGSDAADKRRSTSQARPSSRSGSPSRAGAASPVPSASNAVVPQGTQAASTMFTETTQNLMSLYNPMLSKLSDLTREHYSVLGNKPPSLKPTSRAIIHALTAEYPMTRYLCGWDARVASTLRWVLPDRLADWGFLTTTQAATMPPSSPSSRPRIADGANADEDGDDLVLGVLQEEEEDQFAGQTPQESVPVGAGAA